jgi:hypothetical protein
MDLTPGKGCPGRSEFVSGAEEGYPRPAPARDGAQAGGGKQPKMASGEALVRLANGRFRWEITASWPDIAVAFETGGRSDSVSLALDLLLRQHRIAGWGHRRPGKNAQAGPWG